MGLMLIQVIGVIQNYLEYEILTRFEMKTHLNIPKISLKSLPNAEKYDKFLDKFKEIYPEFNEKFSNLSESINITELFLTYILKHLSQHNFQEYFDSILDPKSIVKSCYFVINRKNIDCPKPEYYLEITFEKHVLAIADLFGNLNKTEKSILINLEIEKYLEKIVIELDSYSIIFLEIFRNHFYFHFHELPKLALIQSNSINNLFYSSNILRKISSYENQCHDKKDDIFENNFIDKSIIDCWIKNLNQTYSCLPIMSSYLWIPIENDFDSVGYKFCSIEKIGNKSQSLAILKKCKLSLESECNVNLFETKSTLIRLEGIHNRTIVNIIPEISIKPEYSESLKTDLNELIYNCGGIIGMWSGFSAVSITHYTINFIFTKLSKLLKTLFIYLTHYLR
jgi:hypothetical protein